MISVHPYYFISSISICLFVLVALLTLTSSPGSFSSAQQQQLTTDPTIITSSNNDGTTTTIPNNNETNNSTSPPKVILPPFNYSGYFINENAQFSTALRGLCTWTTSDSLCIGTVIPILLITFMMLVLLVYNCFITPQKEALMNAAAVRDSSLWPASLRSLTDEEVQELVASSSGLALKDLFPLLGLESLVQRAAALGLATLKDLLCANALAIRDIGIEVREQRIIARSLERIATHAKKVVAERRKTRKERRQSTVDRRGGGGAGGRASLLATAFGQGAASSLKSGNTLDTNIVLNSEDNQKNAALSSLEDPSSGNNDEDNVEIATNLFGKPSSSGRGTKFGTSNNHGTYSAPSLFQISEEEEFEQLRTVASTIYGSNNKTKTSSSSAAAAAAASSSHTNDDDTNTGGTSSSSVGKEKWKKLKGRMAAYSLMEKLAGGMNRNRRNDDDDDDDYGYEREHSGNSNNNNNTSPKKGGGGTTDFMDI